MSREATDWAAALRPPHPADKAVLWALAESHNRQTRIAYPSVAWIVDFSRWQRKVVLASLARLAALGLIEDTGERVGKTRQVKVWRLGLDMERVSDGDRSPAAKESPSTNLSAPERVSHRDTEPKKKKEGLSGRSQTDAPGGEDRTSLSAGDDPDIPY